MRRNDAPGWRLVPNPSFSSCLANSGQEAPVRLWERYARMSNDRYLGTITRALRRISTHWPRLSQFMEDGCTVANGEEAVSETLKD
jgi:hypothetical protein